MKIFVTGVAGFIGSNLTRELLNRGHKVVGVDNFSFSTKDNILPFEENKDFEFFESDVLKLPKEFTDGVDMIVHLSASKIPRYGKTLDCMNNNIDSLKYLMSISSDIPIVIASTSDVYGKQKRIPFDEKEDLVYGNPYHRRWVYGLSKLIDENYVIAFNEEYNKPYNIARFFNVYGENCALDWTGGCIPQIIGKILKDEPVEIHGDGEQIRCFTHVSDTVDGIVKIVEGEKWNEIFNIGNNYMISINGLVDTIYNILDKKPKKKYIPYKDFFGSYEDVSIRQPDASKITDMLNWKPKVSLEVGLMKTIEDQKQRMGL